MSADELLTALEGHAGVARDPDRARLLLRKLRRLLLTVNTAQPGVGVGHPNSMLKSGPRRFTVAEIEAGTIRKAVPAADAEPRDPTWLDLERAFRRYHTGE